jgi:hypothetical protein
MKHKLLSLLAVAGSLASARAAEPEALIVAAGSIQNITVAENMNIILMQANPEEVSIKITKEASDKLRVSFADNAMRIEPQKKLSKETTVYVIVNGLSSLTVGEYTTVHTRGVLNSPLLDLFVEKGATAHVKAAGTIKAYPMGEFEIDVKKVPVERAGKGR